jgi:fructose-1,6-bisphosphatase/sedoheptulose 1,7-bisphosphatase-like protein
MLYSVPGGAPEGVLTAAALALLNGEIIARLVLDKPELVERARPWASRDPKRIYTTSELATGRHIIFAATGVTEGNLLRGVHSFWRRHAHPLAW